jgi:hypothetical protein
MCYTFLWVNAVYIFLFNRSWGWYHSGFDFASNTRILREHFILRSQKSAFLIAGLPAVKHLTDVKVPALKIRRLGGFFITSPPTIPQNY